MRKPMIFLAAIFAALFVFTSGGSTVVESAKAQSAPCSDGVDNDGDLLTDYSDWGCVDTSGATEVNTQCHDWMDNDSDGKTDYRSDGTGDLQCVNYADNAEHAPGGVPTPQQCEDGIDNDGDTKIDFPQDPGCVWAGDGSEAPNPPLPPPGSTQCSDQVDNDSDGYIDYPADIGCYALADTDEGNPAPEPQCNNAADDDGDGLTDYPADPGCYASSDTDEGNPAPPGGGSVLLEEAFSGWSGTDPNGSPQFVEYPPLPPPLPDKAYCRVDGQPKFWGNMQLQGGVMVRVRRPTKIWSSIVLRCDRLASAGFVDVRFDVRGLSGGVWTPAADTTFYFGAWQSLRWYQSYHTFYFEHPCGSQVLNPYPTYQWRVFARFGVTGFVEQPTMPGGTSPGRFSLHGEEQCRR